MNEIDDLGGPVPAARLRDETVAKRKAQERVAELEQAIARLEQRAATADTLAKQLEEAQSRFTAATTAWDSERAVYQLGITDPEAIEVARHLHGRLPEQDRPPLADWLRAAKDDPTKAPRALSPYLTSAPAPATTPSTPQAAPSPAVSATGQRPAAVAPAAGQGALDAVQIRQLREECARTGDWSRWKEAAPAIRASVRNGV